MCTSFEAGFAKVPLLPALQNQAKFLDEVSVRAVAIRSGNQTGILVTSDIIGISPIKSREFRRKIASTLNLPVESVAFFCTHNHCVSSPELLPEPLGDLYLEAARGALAALEPAEVGRFSIAPQPPLCILRRLRLPDLGAFTFWFGHRDLGDGTADGSHLLKMELNHLAKGEIHALRCVTLDPLPGPHDFCFPDAPIPVNVPTRFEYPPDDQLQGLFFRTPQGRPLGSLLRFPAHAVTTNLPSGEWRSGDYPTYITSTVTAGFGGVSLFIPGPCGNQAPIVERKSLKLARQIGIKLGELALMQLPYIKWESSGPFGILAPEIFLRPRPEFRMCKDELEANKNRIAAEIKVLAEAKAPLRQLKRLAEEYEMFNVVSHGTPEYWGNIPMEQALQDGIPAIGFAARIGSTTLAGMPGEVFGEYTRLLREATGHSDELITFGIANDYVSYLPTAEAYHEGGYEYVQCRYQSDSEERMIAAMRKAISTLPK